MKNKSRILSGLLVLGLSLSLGCATKAGTGAIIGTVAGAGAGAGIGAAVGGKDGAIIGAAAGAVVGGISGAAIGSYMDRQEAALRKKVGSAEIVRQGDELVVRFESGILFDTNKSELRPSSTQSLTDFSQVLKEFSDTDLTIEGHTDSTGSKALNQSLSKSRASSVEAFLAGKGVAQSRMTTVGYADERPIADNATAEGRQENRRVEVKIVPNAKLREQAKQKK